MNKVTYPEVKYYKEHQGKLIVCIYSDVYINTIWPYTSLNNFYIKSCNFILCHSSPLHLPVNMTIPGQYRSSTAYIIGPLHCVSNGPITFCTSFHYRPNTCSRYWPGNGLLQYGTGPVYPHTVLGQYCTSTFILYRFCTGPITFHTGPVLGRSWLITVGDLVWHRPITHYN